MQQVPVKNMGKVWKEYKIISANGAYGTESKIIQLLSQKWSSPYHSATILLEIWGGGGQKIRACQKIFIKGTNAKYGI
jgi:hypothetical protein